MRAFDFLLEKFILRSRIGLIKAVLRNSDLEIQDTQKESIANIVKYDRNRIISLGHNGLELRFLNIRIVF
jgi:hypothetical protein